MKHYELTYLISPELSEEELKTFSKKISNFILEESNLEKTSEPTKIKLAYPIAKRSEAYLITLNFYFQAKDSEKLKNLKEKLTSEAQILRYIILTEKEQIKVSKKIPEPQKLIKEEKLVKKITRPAESNEPMTRQSRQGGIEKVELKEIDKKIEEILNE